MEMDLDMDDYDDDDDEDDDDNGYNGVRLDQSHNDMESYNTQTDWSGGSITNGTSQAHHTPQQGIYSTFIPPQTIPDRSLALSPAQTKPKLADFELLKTLGTGTFARVWLTRPIKSLRTSPAQLYALKQLRKTDGR